MKTDISHRPLWIVPAALLCAAGMWLYANRVLIRYQISDAAAHDRPRGNLSDLYPRWLGARELLLYGRDPYSPEVTREIQVGYYGRPLDPSRPNDPLDQEGFAYPVYVVFWLAPTIGLPFALLQKIFYCLLLLLSCAGTLLWLRMLRSSAPLWMQISLVALTLGSPAVMQGLKLRQITLLVAGLIAIAIALLVSDYQVAAGFLLAAASIKPQLVVLLLCWLAIWVIGDWRRRYRLAASFLATMTVLVAASEWYLPHWIPRFWKAIREYQHYTASASVMDNLFGSPWSWVLELLACTTVISICWRERRQPANTASFVFTVSLALAATVLIVPTCANYNQVLVIPAVLVLAKERHRIWRRSFTNRILFLIVGFLVLWPWLSSTTLVALSFLLPRATVDRAWALPFWTVIQIPVAVVALMLAYYRQTSFASPPRLRPS
jgi:Glycosyltransferase family 87